MTYLFYGLEEFLIEQKINKLIEKENLNNLDIIKYDLENSSLNSIIDDAMTMSLFNNKKIIIVDNSYIFTGTTNKKLPDQNIDILNEYIINPNKDTILIFKLLKETIDNRKKLCSNIKKWGEVVEFNKNDNINAIVKDLIHPYTINNDDILFLIDRVGNNAYILKQEINKIISYKDGDMHITRDDIINLTSKCIDTDIFNLIDNIINGNKKQSIESYKEMVKLGEEPIKIIIMLANQIRIMYQSIELQKIGYSEKDIASSLEIHPYRVKLALNKSKSFNSSLLLDYLHKLADLDINIKTGKIDKDLGIELFLLSI